MHARVHPFSGSNAPASSTTEGASAESEEASKSPRRFSLNPVEAMRRRSRNRRASRDSAVEDDTIHEAAELATVEESAPPAPPAERPKEDRREMRASKERASAERRTSGTSDSFRRRDSAASKEKKERLRNSIAISEELGEAVKESDKAMERANEAARAAARAQALISRQAWEKRVMRFLADGNAVLKNGTPVRTWVAVQDELERAEERGVPLSETARKQYLQMGTAAHAIKAAGESARLAADAAAKEWAGTKAGARAANAARKATFVESPTTIGAEITR